MSLESGIAGAPTHLARRSQSSHPAPFVPLVEYEDASPGAKAVFDTIIARRGLKDASQINNFWRALANDEKTLKRTWESVEEVMAPGGALDPLVKQLIYIAVSQVNNCGYW
ncbi:AhpD-like protein [Hyaloraphidium curvatum]|nr:AhpD-like protein [Hyaloraphidium curvatum]